MTPTKLRTIAPLDLQAEYALLGSEIEEAVVASLRSGRHIGGPAVDTLEKSFAEMCGVEHAVAVSSGTDALVLGLHAVGVKPGDTVVTSPFTFFASAGAIAWVGARPLLADVDPETALLSPEAAASAIDGDTSCLLPVHLYGQPVDLAGFRKLADDRGLRLLEDAAQAHGSARGGVRTGEKGCATAFSFYPTKNLGTAGEGGMVVTPSAEVHERLSGLRDHGSKVKYRHDFVGTNGRLNAIQATVLNVKFPHLEAWNARRRQLAARYDEALASHPDIRPLVRVPDAQHVYHQYTVRVPAERRDEVQKRLAEEAIHVAVHYPTPVHLQPAAAGWGYGPGDFPQAEALAREVLCLPIHPFLQDEDVDRVAEALGRVIG